MGLATDKRYEATRLLLYNGYTADECVDYGIGVGKFKMFDRFRNRIMFPISNDKGQVIAFGARSLHKGVSKYMNSPTTSVFTKNRVLYGIDKAIESMSVSKTVIIVEGYMDVIMIHQAVRHNVIGLMGTALSKSHIAQIKDKVKTVILMLDGDKAGREAALRSLVELNQGVDKKIEPVITRKGYVSYAKTADVEIKVAVLPEGEDPCSLAAKDPLLLLSLITDAWKSAEFVLIETVKAIDTETAGGKSKAVKAAIPIIRNISSVTEQDEYICKLAQMVGVPEKTIKEVMLDVD